MSRNYFVLIKLNRFESVSNPIVAIYEDKAEAKGACNRYNRDSKYNDYDYYFKIQEIVI